MHSRLNVCLLQSLTLSQTTNFILFQTERVCRRQEVLQKGRKHCGKRRNRSLRAISPFLAVFSKDLYCRHVKPGLVWERVNTRGNDGLYHSALKLYTHSCPFPVTLYQTILIFNDKETMAIKNIEEKRRKCW